MSNYHANVGDILKVIRAEDEEGAKYVGKKGEVTKVHLFPTAGNVYELRMEDGALVEFYEYEVEHAEEPEEYEIRQTFEEMPTYEPNFYRGVDDPAWEEMETVGREIIEDYNADSAVRDSVEHPSHYTQGKFETIEIIEEITGGYEDGFVSYCVGNSLKYLSRAPFKHESMKDDIAKAKKYLEFALERIERDEG